MARKRDDEDTSSKPTTVVELLVRAADGDTLFRDLYLLRARELLSPLYAESRYRSAAGEREEAERCLQQARVATTRRDWERVRDLSARAAALQQGLKAAQELQTLAESVYGAPAVVADPFSPGIGAPRGKDVRSLHVDAIDALDRLKTADAVRTDLYTARQAAVTALRPQTASAGSEKKAAESVDHTLRVAAERGDAEQLRELAEKMLSSSPATAQAAETAAGPRTRFEAPSSLAQPLPQASLERAGALGLESVQSHLVPNAAAAVREFLDSYGWGPATPELGKAKEGVTHLRTLAKEHLSSPELAETAAETVALFATQVFINSGGLRYVPIPVDTESCLIESFPEGEQPVTELLKALGLSRRRGLARADIENALLLQGGRVLEERLGLDPREFRLVCIPPDLYLRVGRERGWGQRPDWTHFDGYRVLQGGRLLALVGGNARYGGRVDLAAIGPTDERDSVLARFAVIRRDRLGARPAA